MGCQGWIWVVVALVLSSSVMTTAKFNPHVSPLLNAGKGPASLVNWPLSNSCGVTAAVNPCWGRMGVDQHC